MARLIFLRSGVGLETPFCVEFCGRIALMAVHVAGTLMQGLRRQQPEMV